MDPNKFEFDFNNTPKEIPTGGMGPGENPPKPTEEEMLLASLLLTPPLPPLPQH